MVFARVSSAPVFGHTSLPLALLQHSVLIVTHLDYTFPHTDDSKLTPA